ncbi:MAG: hypothetical protein DRO99_02335 [Candidatus Aenigmatarchaeota archaeon]|nr:MAG: hypothetical protein DRO99_02335 [Candidatus Aenigmarchaeota archaeon]
MKRASFRDRLKRHASSIFPECGICEIEMVSRNPKRGKLETATYKIKMWKECKSNVIFAKRFGDSIYAEHKDDIEATLRLSRADGIKTPELFGFYKDINSFIMKGAVGKSLFNMIAKRPIKRGFSSELRGYVSEVAKSVAALQNKSLAGKEKIMYALTEDDIDSLDLSSASRVKEILREANSTTYPVSRIYGDLKLSHVLVKGGEIQIIDCFPFSKCFCYINPVAFSVSMELAQRVPYFSGKKFKEMRSIFYNEYQNSVDIDVDLSFMRKLEILKKCELLGYFSRSLQGRMPLLHRLSANMDSRYIRKSIERDLKEV